MKIGKYIKTVTYPRRIIPFTIPKREEQEKPIPVQIPQKEPVKVSK